MKITQDGLALIHGSEACRLIAYDDNGNKPGGTWTIGWGTTVYPPWHLGGRRVRPGDQCTRAQADAFFDHRIQIVERRVDELTTDRITPRQNDALCCLVYNIGDPGYQSSTVRRRVNADPLDPTIREAWMRWHYQTVDGVAEPVYGLWVRRHREADYYFGVTTEEPDYPHPRGI